jgi:ribonuclease P protein component
MTHRMRLSRDFDTAVRRGRRAGRRTLVVHAAVTAAAPVGDGGAMSDDDLPARVGLIVSRAVGSAVTRNRVKRRLRAAMQSRVDALPGGSLVVLRANPPAATATGRELVGDLDSALRRVLGPVPERTGRISTEQAEPGRPNDRPTDSSTTAGTVP